MIWQGKELVTWGDIGAAAAALTTREEADAFMAAYRAEQPEYADQNIGYLSGYYDRETRERIQDLCGVSHPILGRSHPTEEQLAAAGRAVMLGARPDDVRRLLDPTVDTASSPA
jgi:hypothetical protein